MREDPSCVSTTASKLAKFTGGLIHEQLNPLHFHNQEPVYGIVSFRKEGGPDLGFAGSGMADNGKTPGGDFGVGEA